MSWRKKQRITRAVVQSERMAADLFERLRDILSDPHGCNVLAHETMKTAYAYQSAARTLRKELKERKWTMAAEVSEEMAAKDDEPETVDAYRIPETYSDLTAARAVALNMARTGSL